MRENKDATMDLLSAAYISAQEGQLYKGADAIIYLQQSIKIFASYNVPKLPIFKKYFCSA